MNKKCQFCNEKAVAYHQTKPVCKKCWDKLHPKPEKIPPRHILSLEYLRGLR